MPETTIDNLPRIDKWLWCVRIFKTRSKASEACRKKKVLLNEKEVKPSRAINIGDVIQVTKKEFHKTVKVKELLYNRVGPKLVADYLEDMTPEQKPEQKITYSTITYSGKGRPTKRDRRKIDKTRE